jgi:hypothetical protein
LFAEFLESFSRSLAVEVVETWRVFLSARKNVAMKKSNHQSRSANGKSTYSLRKGLGVWELTFKGRQALLKHEQGLLYVSWLLLNPPQQPIHGMALTLKVLTHFRNVPVATTIPNATNGLPVTVPIDASLIEQNLRFDDIEAAAALRRKQLQLETILEDPMQSDQMKADVSRDLESIYAFEKQNRHRTTDMAQKAVRSVRMAIKRLHQRLSVATDQRGKPHPVLVPFAGHLHKYLIVPSARYCSPRGLLARAGLAGCFTYEPPENVVWVG